MLKFLTHKLRTHSLNEDPNQEKTDDDHDSGTESDDEFQDGTGIGDEPSSPMESLGSPAAPDSAVPSDSDFGAPPPPPFGFLPRDGVDDPEDEVDPANKNGPLDPCQSRRTDLLLLLNYNEQHSSEEELEVINSPKTVASQGCRPATAPEKRKWSQVSSSNTHTHTQTQTQSQPQQQHTQQQQQLSLCTDVNTVVTTCSAPASRAGREPAGSGSSDEEVQGLLGSRSGSGGSAISQPVQFRTSPPVDAHKPGRSLSPPPKLFHASTRDPRPSPRPRSRPRPHPHSHSYLHTHLDHHHHHHVETDADAVSACSPRKRHRPPHRLPRPCLDFEKMQQLKARAVTAWRHSGEHGSELSVFCW